MTNSLLSDRGAGLAPELLALSPIGGTRRPVKVVEHPAFAPGDMVEQQGKLGPAPRRLQPLQVAQILPVERDDMVEAIEILRPHLAGAKM